GEEIEKGLVGEKSSLAMLPTFVTRRPKGTETGPFLALHFGTGSHLRVVMIYLNSGKIERTRQKRYFVSEERRTKGTGEELFAFIGGCVKDFLDTELSDFADRESPFPLSFAFAFPIEQTGIREGKLIKWTKGWDIPDVEGRNLV